MVDEDRVLVKKQGGVTYVTLNRPEKMNALDRATITGLGSTFKSLALDKGCRAVIITGNGKAFCAGADINYLASLKSPANAGKFIDTMHRLYDTVETLEKPVIAAINGYCLGGGFELALACDARIASTDAMFGLPEVSIGIMPGAGATFRLPKLIGMTKAKEMIFSSDRISAAEALNIGLVNKVVEPAGLKREAAALVGRFLKNSSASIRNAKRAVNAMIKSNEAAEKSSFMECFKTGDAQEGFAAFLEHRKPKFK